MSRYFHLQVDEPALTDALFGFVTDPTPTRNQRPVIHELHEFIPGMVSVLEYMVIDGVNQRRHVEEYVLAALGEMLV